MCFRALAPHHVLPHARVLSHSRSLARVSLHAIESDRTRRFACLLVYMLFAARHRMRCRFLLHTGARTHTDASHRVHAFSSHIVRMCFRFASRSHAFVFSRTALTSSLSLRRAHTFCFRIASRIAPSLTNFGIRFASFFRIACAHLLSHRVHALISRSIRARFLAQ